MPIGWKRAKELFHATLDLDPPSRGVFLTEACAGDTGLRAEIESLIAAYERDPTFIESPALVGAGLPLGRAQATLVGRQIGPYRLTRVVASGGMGTVYQGERTDAEYTARVAVKVIRSGALADDPVHRDQMRRRVAVERQSLASLDHPCIARLLDAGTTDDGEPYLIMEYVDGRPIDAYCDDRNMTIAGRLDLVRAVCGAVHYAHQTLVVHRDLKPSNILVTERGTGGTAAAPKLLDFGIATILEPGGAGSDPTRTLVPPMTPAYASPEQARGDRITTSSDVYAVGILLYELTTGRRPYRLEGKTPLEAIRTICDEEPVRPSSAVLREPGVMRPGGVGAADLARLRGTDPVRLSRLLTGDLDSIILKALSKEPARRYHSAQALGEDLLRFREGRPVEARPTTRAYRAAKFIRRHPLGVAAAAGIALAVSTGVAGTLWQAVRATRNLARAQSAERLASERAGVNAQTARYLVDLLGDADPSAPSRLERPRSPASAASAIEFLRRGEQRLGALESQPAVRAALMAALARAYASLGVAEKARGLAEASLELRRAFADGDSTEVAESLETLAEVLRREGRPSDAAPLLRESIAMRRRIEPSPRAVLAGALNALGLTLKDAGDAPGAESAFREAIRVQLDSPSPDQGAAAQVKANLAWLLEASGDVQQAVRLNREALATLESIHTGDDPIVAASLINLAFSLSGQGDHAEAAAALERALQILRRTVGDDDPWVATALNNLGMARLELQDRDGSDAALREALAIRTRVLGGAHPLVAQSLSNLGILLLQQRRAADAEDHFQRALALYAASPGTDRIDELRARDHLALVWLTSGRTAEAEQLLRDTLAIHRALERPDPFRLANTASGLGQALMAQGNAPEAEPLFRESLELRRALDPESWETARSETLLAGCLTQLGRFAEAEPLLLASLATIEARFGASHPRTRQAIQGCVALYEATGDAASAAQYRSRLQP